MNYKPGDRIIQYFLNGRYKVRKYNVVKKSGPRIFNNLNTMFPPRLYTTQFYRQVNVTPLSRVLVRELDPYCNLLIFRHKYKDCQLVTNLDGPTLIRKFLEKYLSEL